MKFEFLFLAFLRNNFYDFNHCQLNLIIAQKKLKNRLNLNFLRLLMSLVTINHEKWKYWSKSNMAGLSSRTETILKQWNAIYLDHSYNHFDFIKNATIRKICWRKRIRCLWKGLYIWSREGSQAGNTVLDAVQTCTAQITINRLEFAEKHMHIIHIIFMQ